MTSSSYLVLFRELSIPLVTSVWVGRDEACDIVIPDDPKVSRKHARFLNLSGIVSVEDHASANGTFVNGARVITPLRVNPGDEVRVGDERLALRTTDSIRPNRRTGRPARSDTPRPQQLWPQAPATLTTEPYGVDLYHVRWLQIEDAIASNDWALADDLMTAQFRRVGRASEEFGSLPSVIQAKLCRHAIDMAVATGEGVWLNKLFDVHARLKRPLPEAAADALPSMVGEVRNLDLARLRTLVKLLQTVQDELTPSEHNACRSLQTTLDIANEATKTGG